MLRAACSITTPAGENTFEWINNADYMRDIFSFIRRNPWNYNDALVFVCNFAPVERAPMEIGVPVFGRL